MVICFIVRLTLHHLGIEIPYNCPQLPQRLDMHHDFGIHSRTDQVLEESDFFEEARLQLRPLAPHLVTIKYYIRTQQIRPLSISPRRLWLSTSFLIDFEHITASTMIRPLWSPSPLLSYCMISSKLKDYVRLLTRKTFVSDVLFFRISASASPLCLPSSFSDYSSRHYAPNIQS